MKADVADLLATLDPHEDPLDALMGLRWAQLDLGRVQRVAISNAVRAQRRASENRDEARVGRSGGGGSAGRRSSVSLGATAPSDKPQAMVKLISGGGTSCRRGLGGQMDYLRKEGAAELERSERFMGIAIDAEGEQAIAEQWGLPITKSDKQLADRTTHFVVSFPEGTEHGAAYRAGRAWADTLFGSGEYGDTFDYYTAFHTDRAHPHMHVVVNRRGLDEDSWLKVSKRSTINYDELRAVQVEAGAREGIELEATPRLARGVHERRVPDAEIQRARAQGREPVVPMHTVISAVRTAVLAHDHVRLSGRPARAQEDVSTGRGERSLGDSEGGPLSDRSEQMVREAQERREARSLRDDRERRQEQEADPVSDRSETEDQAKRPKRSQRRERDRGLDL